MRLPLLQKNPMTMVGTIDRCWLFTLRTPEAVALHELPAGLTLVTHGGFAFWNVVVSHIDDMRPVGTPVMAGVSYWHVAYRLYVRVTPPGRPAVEGLYFVRSDCDNRLMARVGNIVTDFNFHVATIDVADTGPRVSLGIQSPDARASATLLREPPLSLPDGSPFASLKEAATFLKYKPFGISVNPGRDEANIVRISRVESDWRARLVRIEEQSWDWLTTRNVEPEICYEVAPIFYTWNRGRVVTLR